MQAGGKAGARDGPGKAGNWFQLGGQGQGEGSARLYSIPVGWEGTPKGHWHLGRAALSSAPAEPSREGLTCASMAGLAPSALAAHPVPSVLCPILAVSKVGWTGLGATWAGGRCLPMAGVG